MVSVIAPLTVKVAPLFIVTFFTETAEVIVTALVPVVAITMLSPVAGAVPPTQVLPDVNAPPVAVLVRVAAPGGTPSTLRLAPNNIIKINRPEQSLVIFLLVPQFCIYFFIILCFSSIVVCL